MTEEQIIIGLPKIIENAELIFADATLLADSNRIGRAYSLFQLSIEEIAKAFILTRAILFEDISKENIRKKLIKEISDHKTKSKGSIVIESFFHEYVKTIDIERYKRLFDDSIVEYNDSGFYNKKKNDGFYVSFDGNKFQSPSELISIDELVRIKSKARLRIFVGKTIVTSTIEKIEILKERINDNQKFGKD